MKTRNEVSAGGVVYRPRDGGGYDVVIIRTHEDRWQLPKGWVEEGESPEQAAVREVREEGGVDGSVVGPIDRIEYWYRSKYDPEPVRVHKFVQFFLLTYQAGTTDDHDDEVREARWIEIGEAEQTLSFKDERRVVSMAREALERVAAERQSQS